MITLGIIIAHRGSVKYIGFIGIWLLVPLVVVSLPFDAPGLTCLAMLHLFLLGPCLGIGFLILFLLTRRKPQAAAAFFLVVALWLLSLWNGFAVGARIHLLVNEERYAGKIRLITQAKSLEEKVRICADDCLIHPQPFFVAFHYCHCPMFWPDIVYDPGGTLDVDKNNLQRLDFYLRDARHLKTFWYIGYFGD